MTLPGQGPEKVTWRLPPPVLVKWVRKRPSPENSRLLTLTELKCGRDLPINNVFLHGEKLFLTWYDGVPAPVGNARWRWASALWTPG